MPRPPIPTWFYALVVVRRGEEFLVVQEPDQGQPWYLPAGRVEPGESLVQAAQRETLEEAGLPVVIDGVVRVEHTPRADGTARVRVVFSGHPADDRPPKCVADADSICAAWKRLSELRDLPLRSPEVLELFEHIARGGPVYPLELLGLESGLLRSGS